MLKCTIWNQTALKWVCLFVCLFFFFSSLGCGIGYGYLHRIPTRPFEEGKKIHFPGNSQSEPVSPLKDGFTEVSLNTLLTSVLTSDWRGNKMAVKQPVNMNAVIIIIIRSSPCVWQ